MKNVFLQELQNRGYLNQCTNLNELDEICNKKSISGYIGFDCTASSLHVGSLLQKKQPNFDSRKDALEQQNSHLVGRCGCDHDHRNNNQRPL